MTTISRVEAPAPKAMTRKKVAAYARVSKNTERTMHSMSAQISYYNSLIQKNSEWEFAGIYSDEAITGTSAERRPGFMKLIEDCETGKIDIVLTKSISRFARNTVDLLDAVRHLKKRGVAVNFEKDNIDSLTTDGELMLTILASYAQEEVQAMSENIRWTIQKQFKKGQLNGCCRFLGYRWYDEEKTLLVVPEEAELVRRIFKMYESGSSLQQICRALTNEGIPGIRGGKWEKTSISQILQNITYTGNLLLQKTYSQDPITKKSKKNKGERPQYYSEKAHEAIIDMETFQAVQKRLEHMREIGNSECYELHPFSRKLVCSDCGSRYMRRTNRKKTGTVFYSWICWKHKQEGSKGCKGRGISEIKLKAYSCDVLGWEQFDGDKFRDVVEKIIVKEDGLEFFLYGGTRKEIADVKRNHYSGKKKDTVK